MDRKMYCEAFDKIQFSPDMESRIMEADGKSDPSGKAGHKWRYAVISVACLCIIACLFFQSRRGLECELLSRSALEEMEDVREIVIEQMENEDGKTIVDTVTLDSGQMIILDGGLSLDKEEKAMLIGNIVQEENCNYEVGYIYDGDYNILKSCADSPIVCEEISAQEFGAVKCYIQNCRTGETSEISSATGSYGILESAAYRIYGVAASGKVIDLSEKISITETIWNQDGVLPLTYIKNVLVE